MDREEMLKVKEQRGYSFRQLSEYTGIPAVTLQKVFSGQSKSPRQATLDAIEKVLRGDEAVYSGKAFKYKVAVDSPQLGETAASYNAKAQGEYTVQDYYRLPEDKRYELIDGVLYAMGSPRLVHQDIVFKVNKQIDYYIEKNAGDCMVFSAAVDVQLDKDDRTVVQPDVLVVCSREKIKGSGIFGAPDFILEVLSDSTRKKDMTIKLYKYLDAGVREYWMIDPNNRVLIKYNFIQENFIPEILPLCGSCGMAIYEDKLQIDLDVLNESIDALT